MHVKSSMFEMKFPLRLGSPAAEPQTEFSCDLLYWTRFTDIQVIYLVSALRKRAMKKRGGGWG